MDFTKALLKEHSRKQAEKIARYVGNDAERFKELLTIFLKGEYRLTQRASWALTICCDKHPELITPHLKSLINYLSQKNLHNAVIRNSLRILQFQKIPKSLQAKIINLCFDFLLDKKQPVAIKVFAMTILGNLTVEHPEIKNELRIAIEDQMPYESAGFKARAGKILKMSEP